MVDVIAERDDDCDGHSDYHNDDDDDCGDHDCDHYVQSTDPQFRGLKKLKNLERTLIKQTRKLCSFKVEVELEV